MPITFKPLWYNQYLVENLRVTYLISPMSKRWNIPVLEYIFRPHEVEAIQLIPFYEHLNLDIPIWHYTDSGPFTVSSAFNGVMNELARTKRKIVPTTSQGQYSLQ